MDRNLAVIAARRGVDIARAQRLVANRYSLASLRRHLSDAGVDAFEIATQLPIQLRRLQTLLDEGGPEVHLRTADLEPLVDRLDVISKRVVFGVVTEWTRRQVRAGL